MRTFVACALATAFLAAATAASAEDKCGSLQMLNRVQLIHEPGGPRDLIPVQINGVAENFMFDTGTFVTTLTDLTAAEASLPLQFKNVGGLLTMSGGFSLAAVNSVKLTVGSQQTVTSVLPVIHMHSLFGGLFGMDYIAGTDADIDFGTDTYSMISPDHCPGAIAYWKPAVLSSMPFSMVDGQIRLTVAIDGHDVDATVDTGSTDTMMRMDVAKDLFGIVPGATDTPKNDTPGGGGATVAYSHVFKTMDLNGISVVNAKIIIFPDAIGAMVHGRVKAPKVIIGMNVLRKLHLYFAFQEQVMYVSAATPSSTAATQPPPSADLVKATFAKQDKAYMGLLDQAAAARILGIDPHLSAMLCATHANFDSNLEHALDVCDRVILHTGRVFIHAVHVQEEFYRSTILYRLGRYQEALEGLDDAVDADPKDVSALLYRACVKGKLGDTAGKQADIATARAIDAHQADDLLKNLIGDGA